MKQVIDVIANFNAGVYKLPSKEKDFFKAYNESCKRIRYREMLWDLTNHDGKRINVNLFGINLFFMLTL